MLQAHKDLLGIFLLRCDQTMSFCNLGDCVVQPLGIPHVVTVAHRSRPVTANFHRVSLADPCVHQIADGGTPEVVNYDLRTLCSLLRRIEFLAEVRRVEYRAVFLESFLEHVYKLIRQRQNARLTVLRLDSEQGNLPLLQVNLRDAVERPHDFLGFPDADSSVIQQRQ
jgi:hypothetical protein